MSQSRSTVERGFGLLKTRWRCLLKIMTQSYGNIPIIILTCSVLHNICQIKQEELHPDDEAFYRNIVQNRGENGNENDRNICDEAEEQRRLLTQYLQAVQ